MKAVNIPTVEVHISNVDAREPFRQIPNPDLACCKTIRNGYREAIDQLLNLHIA